MASTFPQLLKRSAFAAHDPMITRVYASNPRSINAHADWGLKFPVHRGKGSRFIKVGSLDMGVGIGANWQSAEKEARFIETWGDGSAPWQPRTSRRDQQRLIPRTSIYAEEEVVAAPKAEYLPNVEAMTEAEFEKYLAHVKEHRHELRSRLYKDSETVKDEATLPHASARGLVRETASPEFQSDLTSREFAETSSTRLQAQPHKLHGLAYSSTPSGSVSDPARVHQGRALDRTRSQGGFSRGPMAGTNADWVIGLGGVTATGRSQVRITDRPTLSTFDYTRQRPDRGVATFRVSEATIQAPPRVLGLSARADGGARWIERSVSGATSRGPLDSVSFDIKVDEAEDPSKPEYAQPGSRKWVARDQSGAAASTSAESSLGLLGGPRSSRVQGAGAEALRLQHARHTKTQAEAINSLLARITRQSK